MVIDNNIEIERLNDGWIRITEDGLLKAVKALRGVHDKVIRADAADVLEALANRRIELITIRKDPPATDYITHTMQPDQRKTWTYTKIPKDDK